MLKKYSSYEHIIILHAVVLLWGFTGLLGKLITLSAVTLVWMRVLIAAAALLVYILITGRKLRLPLKQVMMIMGTGAVIGVHWILFFQTIKISTVSIALVCLSATTLFTSFIEPLVKKKPVNKGEVVVSLIIIMGIIIIFKVEAHYTLGIVLGLTAALVAAMFNTLTSLTVNYGKPAVIGFYQMAGAAVLLTAIKLAEGSLSRQSFILSSTDWLWLTVLGTVCTAVTFVGAVYALRKVSAFTIALVTNLEPIYGIIIAVQVLGAEAESMSTGFYIGGAIIMLAVLFYSRISRYFNSISI